MRSVYSMAAAVLIPAIFASGCAALDFSASGEGTGAQAIGAIVVLARYQASERQKAAAEARARQVFVERALQPAYKERVKKLEKLATARPRRPRPSTGSAGATPAEPDTAAKAKAELAALSASWQSAAASLTGSGTYASDFAVPGLGQPTTAAVNFPKMSESDVLAAGATFVPRYLAVSVPSERSVRGASETVMLWDTRTRQLASDTVFALERTPSASKPSKIDGLEVQFDVPRRAAVD